MISVKNIFEKQMSWVSDDRCRMIGSTKWEVGSTTVMMPAKSGRYGILKL